MPTVVLQPTSQDSYFMISQNVNNNGQGIRSGDNGGANQAYRGVLQFNLSSIPAGAVISAATLEMRLSAIAGGAMTLTLLANEASWNETTVTGGNAPAFSAYLGSSALHDTWWNETSRWYAWNVSTTVSYWVSGYANYGWTLQSNIEGQSISRYATFRDKEDPNTDWRPKLTVTYNQPPSAPTGLAPAGTSYTFSQNVAFTWTHNDPDGDPQSSYEIRWRRSGSADSYSTLTATTSTQSRNEPASTFGAGTWEYNVRTKDSGASTFGAWSTTQTFTVTAIERWGVVHI